MDQVKAPLYHILCFSWRASLTVIIFTTGITVRTMTRMEVVVVVVEWCSGGTG